MKYLTTPLLLILFFTSCTTSNHVHYNDPNYLSSDEFNTYKELHLDNQTENKSLTIETDYTVDNYYDYSFSSRIRRFHRPMYYSDYYGGIYTDYYWYNNDPFSCGTSIYYGYNWHSPYYSYYSYSPYYSNYHTPYYYGNYYSYNGYGYNNDNHASHNTYYSNANNYNSYINGNRGSLSSNLGGRDIKRNTILSNTTNKTSTLNIRDNNTLKDNTINVRNYKPKSNIKTNDDDRSNSAVKSNKSSKKTTKTNSNRRNNSNSTNKKNSRSYSSKNRNNKSNSGQRSSRGGGRNAKPRK